MNLSLFADLAFCGDPLDRADHLRRDDQAIAALRMLPTARFLVLDDLKPILSADGNTLNWTSRSNTPDGLLLFLGLGADGAPHFAVDDTSGATPANGARTVDPRRAAALLTPADSAILAQARSLLDWHRRHGHCANCGAPTIIAKAGYSRLCNACATEHFPRVDPVVIMLAEHDERVLVGRGVHFPGNFFSALAGFVEPGESLEQAVGRELSEEAGIAVHNVRIIASQPWPFPSSLMIGAHADAVSDTLTLDESEIVEARWVSRQEVRAALAGKADWNAPQSIAIANRLLHRWAYADPH